MSEVIRPIPLQNKWEQIAAQLDARPASSIKPFLPQYDGSFACAVLAPRTTWSRATVVVFPYEHPRWQDEARAVLAFEARCWGRWCSLQEEIARRNRRDRNAPLPIPPVWWQSTPPISTAPFDVTIHIDDERSVRLPALIRPYIPYPSLAERSLPRGVEVQLTEELHAVARWTLGDASPAEYFAASSPPLTARQPPGWFSWWPLLVARFRRTSQNVFVWPSELKPQHLLSNGTHLVPTHWRVFHSKHSRLGHE